MAVYPGPYLCMMCSKEPQPLLDTWRGCSVWIDPPFEVDDGRFNTTKDEAWIYCKACDCWTAFAPIPDENPTPPSDATQRQD